MMGIGPIRMIAPLLAFGKLVIEPRAIRSVPMKIAAKANRNKMLIKLNW